MAVDWTKAVAMASQGLRSKWTFHSGDLGAEDVQCLLAFHFEQMRGNSPPDACHVLALDGLRDPAVTFWSLREEGRLLAVGALKQLDPKHGEVKSMRTAPEALGRGAGSAMLDHIVAEARRRGYEHLSLETGSTEHFAAALRLYERDGFVPSGPFGGYQPTPFTRFYTRQL